MSDVKEENTAPVNPKDSVVGKMFIGGLDLYTTEEHLRKTFEKYGELTDCIVMRDSMTNRSRCFGFITYGDEANVDKALADAPLHVDGKAVDAKRAVPRNEGSSRGSAASMKVKKIFVGGLALTTTEKMLKEYFGEYGTVTDAVLMYDQMTQRPRGFGFVSFETEDMVEDLMSKKSWHEIDGKSVEIKKAEPRSAHPPPRGGGYGGYGGGYDSGYGGRGRGRALISQRPPRHMPYARNGGGYNGGPGRAGGYRQGGGGRSAYPPRQPAYYDDSYGGYDQRGYDAPQDYSQQSGGGYYDDYYQQPAAPASQGGYYDEQPSQQYDSYNRGGYSQRGGSSYGQYGR